MNSASFLVLLLLPAFPASEKDDPGKVKWIRLFNGKDLTGWTVKIKGYDLNQNHADTFRVEDGILKVSYDRYLKFDGKFGHLFFKEKFPLRLTPGSQQFSGE